MALASELEPRAARLALGDRNRPAVSVGDGADDCQS